jgi:hypothetical protein
LNRRKIRHISTARCRRPATPRRLSGITSSCTASVARPSQTAAHTRENALMPACVTHHPPRQTLRYFVYVIKKLGKLASIRAKTRTPLGEEKSLDRRPRPPPRAFRLTVTSIVPEYQNKMLYQSIVFTNSRNYDSADCHVFGTMTVI